MNRRSFVRTAATLAAAGLTGACTSSTLQQPAAATGPAGPVLGSTPPTPVPTTAQTATAADWTAFGQGLSGHLVQPDDADYSTARLLFDPRFDGLRPAGVAYCDNPADVAQCLAFVQRYGIAVTPRAGGHSYAGYSSGSGLVIDVTRMNTVSSVSGGTARVGAGTRLVDLYSGLDAHGVTVPGGSCPTVGVAGLALGGGIGVVGRAYGTLSDNIASVQIVTPDGTVRECNAQENADLFWACRGGGGGNFGVATAFTFTTHPTQEMVLFFLNWPWSQTAKVISAWQAWAPSAPDQLWSNLHALSNPNGSPSIQVGGTYIGSMSSAQQEISKLVAAVGSTPQGTPFQASHAQAMMIEAGCSKLSVAQCHLGSQTSQGQLQRESEFAKSHIFTEPLSSAAISLIIQSVEARQAMPGVQGGIALDALGGAINRVGAQDTAFVHRDGLFVAQLTTVWANNASSSQINQQENWLRSFHQNLTPYASGQAYQNYLDPELTGWQQAYYGANYSRLVQVRNTYDPHQVFKLPQGIGAA
ncbi:MAG TPA: FAD-binding oxidoreductase [Actinocrinis sp.]|nr:FAD-binding oxidoreductase [Actinocrinis sp.]